MLFSAASHDRNPLHISAEYAMSCRVIGRTVEVTILEHLCRWAMELGCTSLRGTYIASKKNVMAADVYSKFGFQVVSQDAERSVWHYDLCAKGAITSKFIETVESLEVTDGIG